MLINIKVFWLPKNYRFYGFASEAQMEPTVEVCFFFFKDTQANYSQNLHKLFMSTTKQRIFHTHHKLLFVLDEIVWLSTVRKIIANILCGWHTVIYHLSLFLQSEIFKALEKTRLLVGDKKESQYSRCGRTDKGVSSVGQVSWCRKGEKKRKRILSISNDWYSTWL